MSRDDRREQGGLSLAAKLNLIVVAAILVVSTGLVGIGFRVYSDRVDEFYRDRMQSAIDAAPYYADPEALAFMWECMKTDDFVQAREQADRQNDKTPIINWMKSVYAHALDIENDVRDNAPGHVFAEYETLYDVYRLHVEAADSLMQSTGITSAYFQFMCDGVTYNLIDPEYEGMEVGSVESPLAEFAGYGDNEKIPPTIYVSEYGWLCTAAIPLYSDGSSEAVAMLCFDDDMNQVMSDRNDFLLNSLQYVAVALVAVLAASLYLVRRIVTRPLHQLTEATCKSFEDDADYEQPQVIDVDIRSDDEIGTLYREIRQMQGRISDHTRDMARISAEKERARTELQMATSIQESVMPAALAAFPERDEFEVFGSMDAAKDVGGDFYDFFLVDDDHLALIIADVSGKGVPAALFMMAVKIMLDDRVLAGGTPAEILASVNKQICSRNPTKTFVTVWMGILDIRTGVVTCSNGGHNYPWVRGADGAFRMLRDKHGLVVGGSKKARYTEYTIELAPGDAIFVHTDGVTEAVNPAREFFGTERLQAALNAQPGANPEATLRAVTSAVDAFADGEERFDDLTMLCVEYRGCARQQAADEITLPATLASIQPAIDFVAGKLDEMACPTEARMKVLVAVDEIAGNIVKYAYGEESGDFAVRFARVQDGDATAVEVVFSDWGRAYNPLEADEPDTTLDARQRTVGGLGLYLVKKTMDKMDYERAGECNVLRICKRIES